MTGSNELEGRVALISGSAQGQGEAEARLFVERGACVVVSDILEDRGRAVVESLDADRAMFTPLDVREGGSWKAAVDAVVARFGKLDVLVNNAAAFDELVPLAELDLEDFMHVVHVNQVGVLLGMQAVHGAMVAAGGGSIVNIASIGGLAGVPMMAPYTATKFAVRGLTRTAAAEWGTDNIRVNAVLPGSIATETALDRGTRRPGNPPKRALSRQGRVDEVAELVCFLASDRSSYCTGGDFLIDGGVIASVLGRNVD
jgi:3alpha(or 20beta)-hydroxysteroid dehydrogenase